MVELVNKSNGAITLVAVSNDENSSDVSGFLKRFPKLKGVIASNPNIIILLDPQGKATAAQFAVLRLPETFVIDKNYLIVRKLVGSIDWLSPDIQKYFQTLAPTR